MQCTSHPSVRFLPPSQNKNKIFVLCCSQGKNKWHLKSYLNSNDQSLHLKLEVHYTTGWSKTFTLTSHHLCFYASMCTYMCVCLSAWLHVHVGVCWSRLRAWTFLTAVSVCLSLCVGGVYVNVCVVTGVSSVRCVYMCVCVSLDSVVCLSCPVLSCLCLVLSPGSTLSAQSAPTMYPGQLALLAPGGLADSGSSTLLQPLKPSPSSNNLCSAYTSEGALSVPSLCAPTPGRHVTEKSKSAAELTSFPTT